jgi:hypothetical protein
MFTMAALQVSLLGTWAVPRGTEFLVESAPSKQIPTFLTLNSETGFLQFEKASSL